MRNPLASPPRQSSLPSRERGLKSPAGQGRHQRHQVAPFTGAWIEITSMWCRILTRSVAPFTGAWIEISAQHAVYDLWSSLPSRERGLKCGPRPDTDRGHVAPFTGAWIEIGWREWRNRCTRVAPLTGAWIEIIPLTCGRHCRLVAPFTGAWIEMYQARHWPHHGRGRSLHGSVD